MGVIETYYDEGARAWKNRWQDGQEVSGVHDRRGEAIARGRTLAVSQGTRHTILAIEGTVISTRDYRLDPPGWDPPLGHRPVVVDDGVDEP